MPEDRAHRDVEREVSAYFVQCADDFDIDGIVDEFIRVYGHEVSVWDIPTPEWEALIKRHEINSE